MSERQGLHNLVAPRGARKKPKRIGRGPGSGTGKTSGRGHKGQKARKSGGVRPGFEGGQLPLARRLPKRGFKNSLFRTDYQVINIGRLAERYGAGDVVDLASLVEKGLLAKAGDLVKVLAEGDLPHALTINVHKVSKSAQQKIEAAGGSVELVPAQSAHQQRAKKPS